MAQDPAKEVTKYVAIEGRSYLGPFTCLWNWWELSDKELLEPKRNFADEAIEL